MRFNPPPGWPVEPGWRPPRGWEPDPAWPRPPIGWRTWVPDDDDVVDRRERVRAVVVLGAGEVLTLAGAVAAAVAALRGDAWLGRVGLAVLGVPVAVVGLRMLRAVRRAGAPGAGPGLRWALVAATAAVAVLGVVAGAVVVQTARLSPTEGTCARVDEELYVHLVLCAAPHDVVVERPVADPQECPQGIAAWLPGAWYSLHDDAWVCLLDAHLTAPDGSVVAG
ncbi:hypothetical protein Cch01nite_35620 [Cellulomonas chitinilytica]|uniref:Uncharacterized protein n=1 Tax=Cellulomonas chitinilytica TaxID=398759 RepID=A0A919U184_9CELL|nr:hypothetical protein [Cellulomonas chitinilytica]GIG22838.1 hypothetical protein Cch01nite_35620 [Cellulomonas chitinilytica]